MEVNELIKLVKKKEVRKQGKQSAARRPMEQSEFEEVIKRFRLSTQPINRFVFSSYFIFQYNLIARVDDVAHFKMEDLT